MSRYPEVQDQPAQPTEEGDSQFLGMNLKDEKSELKPGETRLLINSRCDRKTIRKRGGIAMPTFATVGAGAFLGSGRFSNPNGEEVMLVAMPTAVYQLRSGNAPSVVRLPAGLTLSGKVEFSQQFQNVLLHRDDNTKPTLVWDGTPTGSFDYITRATTGVSFLKLLPNPPWAINFSDRCLFPIDVDTFGASGVDDYTEYDEDLHTFRANSGTADHLIGLYAYTGNQLLIGKRRSFYVAPNFYGDLGDQYIVSNGVSGQPPPTIQPITTELGPVSRLAGLMIGGDFFFLSDTGVYRLGPVITDRLVSGAIPISDKIEPLIKRIYWPAAGGAVMQVLGYYLYLAVPMDGSLVNNVMLVYNVSTQHWESMDIYDPAAGVQLDNLVVAEFYGERHLYGFNHALGDVYCLTTGGKSDQVGPSKYPISWSMESRGYSTLGWNATTKRAYDRFEVAIATLRPNVTITEITEIVGDRRLKTVKPITADRTKSKIWAAPRYKINNSDRNFNSPREDYSVLAGDGFTGTDNTGGVILEQKAYQVVPFAVQTRASYVSYQLESPDGDCDVLGILAESHGTAKEQNRRAG